MTMSAEAVTRLYELVEGTDAEAVRDILKTSFITETPFGTETLTDALNIVTAQLEDEDSVDKRLQICSQLLSAGAKIHLYADCKYDRGHYNMIQHCCKHGNNGVLKQALAAVGRHQLRLYFDGYSNCPYSTSDSPLFLAVHASHIECIEIIFRHCNFHYLHFIKVIEYTAETDNLPSLSHLIKLYKETRVIKPHIAITAFNHKYYKSAKLFIQHCPSIGELMCKTDKEEAWEFILTNMNNNTYGTAKEVAHCVADRKQWRCLKYILQDRFVHAIDLNFCGKSVFGNEHKTVLVNLIRGSQVELLEQLLKYDVYINRPCGGVTLGTPLTIAITQYCCFKTRTNWKTVRALISHGCDVDGYMFDWSWLSFPGIAILEMMLLAGAHIVQPPAENLDRDKIIDIQKAETICMENVRLVHPLKHLARLSIRGALTSLSTTRFGMVSKLGGVLPPALINYLMLPEIDDIEVKYGVLSEEADTDYEDNSDDYMDCDSDDFEEIANDDNDNN